jgi:AcrR family transcriptional regulator
MSTKEKILEAARELLNRVGLDAVSARTICAELNISPGNFTYYYSNKNEVISELYKAMRLEMETVLLAMAKSEINILAYLQIHQQLFLIQEKYKFFYLNLFEILTGDLDLKVEYLSAVKAERKMAVEMLKMYSRQGILKKGMVDEEYERLVDVGQVLNNAWLIDAEILYKGNQKKKMAYYMKICCGLLEPYLTEQSAIQYRKFFKNL